ncbi:Uncharacterised protein [BD1-7 clade bacterium]|uniref:HTH tetR-type domain-containing protein n=1 Tax=BD1-7 clade bacterium TaxID=2029982 RepID=A0A5S9P7Z8_9GAMM|nr:Uncharacterised protein [BD1-7 clade bacterium]CAA0099572.1 Uncharacterised protein [BD1-7 clade bacterium]
MSVNEKKRGRPKNSAGQLNAQIIIDKAKTLMHEEGKVPSIRKLAISLQIDSMAIYHYFSNKNALLESLTTQLMKDIYNPEVNDNWRPELNALCRSYLLLLERYPGLLEIFLKMGAKSPSSIFAERLCVVIAPLHMDTKMQQHAQDLLVDYLHGFALAMRCNDGSSTLDHTMIDDSLDFFCLALESITS